MGDNLVQNLIKIFGALSSSDHQNEAAYEKLVIIIVSLLYYSLESKEFLYCRWGTP